MTWREQARKVINKAIKNCKDENYKKAIDDAYPFSERKMYPYKAWLIERKIAFKKTGLIKEKNSFESCTDKGLFA